MDQNRIGISIADEGHQIAGVGACRRPDDDHAIIPGSPETGVALAVGGWLADRVFESEVGDITAEFTKDALGFHPDKGRLDDDSRPRDEFEDIRIHLGGGADDKGVLDLAGDSADFLMPSVADDDQSAAVPGKFSGLGMDVLDHRAGRIDEFDSRSPDFILEGGREAVALDDQKAVFGLSIIVDGPKTASFQPGKNDFVVDDFSQKIDLCFWALDPQIFDDFDRAVDAAAKTGKRRDIDRRGRPSSSFFFLWTRNLFYGPFSKSFLKDSSSV